LWATNENVRTFACYKKALTEPHSKGSEHEKKFKETKKKPAQPAPIFTKKENSRLEQRIEILDWHHKNGGNQSVTARHFAPIYPNLQIKQPLISSWIKDEAKWRLQWEQTGHRNDRAAKRVRQTEHPQITEMMHLWVSKAMEDGILLTGEVLRQKWIQFADLAGIPSDERLKLSNGWLESFKEKAGLKQLTRHGEAASSKMETVERERQRVKDQIKKWLDDGYELRDLFNTDETGFFWGCVSILFQYNN
jgi:hypothetical protein